MTDRPPPNPPFTQKENKKRTKKEGRKQNMTLHACHAHLFACGVCGRTAPCFFLKLRAHSGLPSRKVKVSVEKLSLVPSDLCRALAPKTWRTTDSFSPSARGLWGLPNLKPSSLTQAFLAPRGSRVLGFNQPTCSFDAECAFPHATTLFQFEQRSNVPRGKQEVHTALCFLCFTPNLPSRHTVPQVVLPD